MLKIARRLAPVIRRVRPLFWVGSVVLFLAAAVVAPFEPKIGLSLIAASLLLLTLGLWFAIRAIIGHLTRLQKRSDRLHREVRAGRRLGSIDDKLGRVTQVLGGVDKSLVGVDAQLAHLQTSAQRAGESLRELPVLTKHSTHLVHAADRVATVVGRVEANEKDHHDTLRRQLNHLQNTVEHTPGLALELQRVATRLAPSPGPLPIPGGWAATASTIVALVDELLTKETITNVVECGSGASTLWMALALEQRGVGHVTALEHEPEFAAQTREMLRRHGLTERATVLDAKLEPMPTTDGEERLWYSLDAIELLPERVDLLFVDGPPAASGPQARRPALPVIGPRLVPGSLVVLDDTDRDEEAAIVRQWQQMELAGEHLVPRPPSGRATFLDLVAGPVPGVMGRQP